MTTLRWKLHEGDCLDWLATLPDQSVNAVISDPPYAEVDREYGRFSEEEWKALMHAVVRECRRILKPRGSAMFVLQSNSENVGKVRPWLWEFMVWAMKEWNLIQDVYWWNPSTPPNVHTHRDIGLLRPSVKQLVWLGPADCYRDQAAVLWSESESNVAARAEGRMERVTHPSGMSFSRGKAANAAVERGGVTPYNLLPISNVNSSSSGGAMGHGAATPYPLCRWWVRYITQPGDIVVDPFTGSGTMGVAALDEGRIFWGAEKMPKFAAIARESLDKADKQLRLFG